jgi:hypothetical protein
MQRFVASFPDYNARNFVVSKHATITSELSRQVDQRRTLGTRTLDAGCWVLGAGCWVLGAGCWVLLHSAPRRGGCCAMHGTSLTPLSPRSCLLPFFLLRW